MLEFSLEDVNDFLHCINWTSEIMDKLVTEGVLSKTGSDTYVINRLKVAQFQLHIQILL